MTFQEIINKLLDNEIEISVRKEDGVNWFNLNTGMKSDLSIAEKDGEFLYAARYSSGSFETYRELLRLVSGCMQGRAYAHHRWLSLLVSEGLLEAQTSSETVYRVVG